jgi:hypothetical protein
MLLNLPCHTFNNDMNACVYVGIHACLYDGSICCDPRIPRVCMCVFVCVLTGTWTHKCTFALEHPMLVNTGMPFWTPESACLNHWYSRTNKTCTMWSALYVPTLCTCMWSISWWKVESRFWNTWGALLLVSTNDEIEHYWHSCACVSDVLCVWSRTGSSSKCDQRTYSGFLPLRSVPQQWPPPRCYSQCMHCASVEAIETWFEAHIPCVACVHWYDTYTQTYAYASVCVYIYIYTHTHICRYMVLCM